MSKAVSALTSARIDECQIKLENMTDRNLLESIQAHFESHPTLSGEKALRDNANKILDDLNSQHDESSSKAEWYDKWESSSVTRQSLAWDFARTRIRETSLNEDFRQVNVSELVHCPVNDLQIGQVNVQQYVSEQSHHNDNVYVGRIEAMLVKEDDNVRVMARHTAGGFTDIGSLPETFVKNNPMTLSQCPAEIEFADFSNGKFKNLSGKVVLNIDMMTGDVDALDNDIHEDAAQSTDSPETEQSDYDVLMNALHESFRYEFDDTRLTITPFYGDKDITIDFENMSEETFWDLAAEDIDMEYDDAMNILSGSKQYEFDGSALIVSDYYTGNDVKLDLGFMTREQFNEMAVEAELDDDFEQAVNAIGSENDITL